MLLVDIKGTEIGRIPDASVTPRAGETARFKAPGSERYRHALRYLRLRTDIKPTDVDEPG
jgi:hypothetical protein